MPVTRYYSSTVGLMTLNGAISAGATSFTLNTVTGLPGARPYTLMIDPGQVTEELVDVTAIGGMVVTVVRGVDGTSAQAHLTGAEVRHCASARDYQDSRNHEAATVAHGATGAVVGTTSTQALTNKSMSGTVNTFSGIPMSALTSGPVAATTVSGTTGTFSGAVTAASVAAASVVSSGAVGAASAAVTGAVTAATVTTTGLVSAGSTYTGTGGSTNAGSGTVTGNLNVGGTTAVSGNVNVGGKITADNMPLFGVDTAAFGGGNTLNTSVTFPTGHFSVPPTVILTLVSGYRSSRVVLVNWTATGFVYNIASTDSVAMSGTFSVHWIAVSN